MQRGTWLVERRSSDKPKVVTRHSGVSYARLLITVVRHLPPRARASCQLSSFSLEPWFCMLVSRTLSFGRETRAHFVCHGDL